MAILSFVQKSTAVLPEHILLGTATAASDVVDEVDFLDRVATTREEQVLGIEQVEEFGSTTQVDGDRPGTVFVVNEQHVAGLDVVGDEVGGPPAGGDTDLIGVASRTIAHDEGLVPNLVPDVSGEGGNTLVVAVVAFKAEAVSAVPVHGAMSVGIVVLPEYSRCYTASQRCPSGQSSPDTC